MDQFIIVAGTEGKVGGYFCRLPPLNENTDIQRQKLSTTDLEEHYFRVSYHTG